MNNYAEYNFHQRYDATREASGLMERQLDELKGKVEKAQQALTDYERKNLIVDIGARQSLVEQRLAALSTDLTGRPKRSHAKAIALRGRELARLRGRARLTGQLAAKPRTKNTAS